MNLLEHISKLLVGKYVKVYTVTSKTAPSYTTLSEPKVRLLKKSTSCWVKIVKAKAYIQPAYYSTDNDTFEINIETEDGDVFFPNIDTELELSDKPQEKLPVSMGNCTQDDLIAKIKIILEETDSMFPISSMELWKDADAVPKLGLHTIVSLGKNTVFLMDMHPDATSTIEVQYERLSNPILLDIYDKLLKM